MQKISQNVGYLSPLGRVFTRGKADGYELVDFDEIDGFGRPTHWSSDITAAFKELAAFDQVPAHLQAVEENTVPSWLWQHGPAPGIKTAAHTLSRPERGVETDAQAVFDRFVGAALYRGWKQGLFASELDAEIYWNEARYALSQRFVTIDPATLKNAGIFWAYGVSLSQAPAIPHPHAPVLNTVDIDNHTIDTVVSGRTDKAAHTLWQTALKKAQRPGSFQLRFVDTIRQWGDDNHLPAACATIDLLAMRHNDGSLNIDTLRQAVRLLITLLDLQDDHGEFYKPISYTNMAALLMGLAIAYDSEEGRATAAAISAIISAEAYLTLANLARLRGQASAYTAHVESVMRALRNHCRAAYGDHADYEKTSILPIPLELNAGVDLTLIAEAQRGWDKALEAARRFGLRHVHATAFGLTADHMYFTGAISQGVLPMPAIVSADAFDTSVPFRRHIHPSVTEALNRLGYDRSQSKAFVTHAVGTADLSNAPAINHASLARKGFTADVLQRLDEYLAGVPKIELAFTPWVLGEDFCLDVLKLKSRDIDNPSFSLLSYLGFTSADIALATAWCCGTQHISTAPDLKIRDRDVFATSSTLSADAQIRMAAAVQSFISSDVAAHITLTDTLERGSLEKVFLETWRQGLKSITLINHALPVSTSVEPPQVPSHPQGLRVKRSSRLLAQQTPTPLPKRGLKAKARAKLVSTKPLDPKQATKTKH